MAVDTSCAIFLITEAYDKMQTELVTAKENLTKILTSKNVKSTVRANTLVIGLSVWDFCRSTKLFPCAVVGDGGEEWA